MAEYPRRSKRNKISEKLQETLTKPTAVGRPEEGSTATVSQEEHNGNKEGSTSASPARPSSPETNCSICLSGLENKSFTDSCFHQFCFVCLLEWSKVKAVCPLCKQPFKSIIHNVRSIEDYDQYHLRNNEPTRPQRFRYRTTMGGNRVVDHIALGRLDNVARGHREHQRQRDMLQRPTRTTARSMWREGRQAATSAFRKRVYHRNMRVEEVQDHGGRTLRYRDVAPQFFSRNPACTHRLVPWLNRELNVLLRNDENHVQFVLELILDLVKRFDIQSEEFKQHLSSFLNRRTEHFIHEFYSFARSPYDMIAYDRHAIYTDPRNAAVQELSSSSDRDEIIQSPYDTMVDLVNASISIDPVVIDTSVIVLDSDDEQLHPSISTVVNQSQTANNDVVVNSSPPAPERPERNHSRDSVDVVGLYENLLVNNAGTATSGWDSPVPGPSSMWNLPGLFQSIMGSALDQSPFAPSTRHVPSKRQRRRHRSRSSPETIDSEPDSIGTIASSHSSDLVVTGVEKPWEERSPIPLSSDDEQPLPQTTTSIKKKKRKYGNEKSGGSNRRHKHSKDSRSKSAKRKHGKDGQERRPARLEYVDIRNSISPPRITLLSPPAIDLSSRAVTISSPESDSTLRRWLRNSVNGVRRRSEHRRQRLDVCSTVNNIHNWLEDIPPLLSNGDATGDVDKCTRRKEREHSRDKHKRKKKHTSHKTRSNSSVSKVATARSQARSDSADRMYRLYERLSRSISPQRERSKSPNRIRRSKSPNRMERSRSPKGKTSSESPNGHETSSNTVALPKSPNRKTRQRSSKWATSSKSPGRVERSKSPTQVRTLESPNRVRDLTSSSRMNRSYSPVEEKIPKLRIRLHRSFSPSRMNISRSPNRLNRSGSSNRASKSKSPAEMRRSHSPTGVELSRSHDRTHSERFPYGRSRSTSLDRISGSKSSNVEYPRKRKHKRDKHRKAKHRHADSDHRSNTIKSVVSIASNRETCARKDGDIYSADYSNNKLNNSALLSTEEDLSPTVPCGRVSDFSADRDVGSEYSGADVAPVNQTAPNCDPCSIEDKQDGDLGFKNDTVSGVMPPPGEQIHSDIETDATRSTETIEDRFSSTSSETLRRTRIQSEVFKKYSEIATDSTDSSGTIEDRFSSANSETLLNSRTRIQSELSKIHSEIATDSTGSSDTIEDRFSDDSSSSETSLNLRTRIQSKVFKKNATGHKKSSLKSVVVKPMK